MPYFYNYDQDEMEISINDFLSECSGTEIDELIDCLIEDGYIKDNDRAYSEHQMSVSESEFEEALNKLHKKWNLLSKEEELAIIEIAKKF
jgi:hypothetical protein